MSRGRWSGPGTHQIPAAHLTVRGRFSRSEAAITHAGPSPNAGHDPSDLRRLQRPVRLCRTSLLQRRGDQVGALIVSGPRVFESAIARIILAGAVVS